MIINKKIKRLYPEDISSDAESIEKLKKGKINSEMLAMDDKLVSERALKDFSPDIIRCDDSFQLEIQLPDILLSAVTYSTIIGLACNLNTMFKSKVPCTLKSNVPDSIINQKLPQYISSLQCIDPLNGHNTKKEFKQLYQYKL